MLDNVVYDGPDEPECAYCPACQGDLEWQDCDACGGEGEFDAYEDDPLWYSPGNMEPCQQCGGAGGWWMCTNMKCGRGVIGEKEVAYA